MSTLNNVQENSISVIAVTASLGAILLLVALFYSIFSQDKIEEENNEIKEDTNNDKATDIVNPVKQDRKKKEKRIIVRKNVRKYDHAWALSCLKGHSGNILGMSFSRDGNHVVTCDDDRFIHLWNCKDFNEKEHRSSRSNVEYDHLTKIAFSPDGKAIIGQLSTANTIRVFKSQKKKENNLIHFQSAFDYAKQHEEDVIDVGVSSTGRFVMACYADTSVRLFDLKGALLDVIDTHQMSNSHAQISPCGNLLATSGFTPDIIVWQVKFDKSGGYGGFSKAFDLCGHNAGIHYFDFANQAKRVVSISKDKKWKVWDIDIEYQLRQDAVLLQTGNYTPSSGGRNLCAISRDGLSVAIAVDNDAFVYDVKNGDLQTTMKDVHTAGIVALSFDYNSEILATAGDRFVQLTQNVVGLRSTLSELKKRLIKETLSSALKNRINEQISNIRKKLMDMNEKEVFTK